MSYALHPATDALDRTEVTIPGAVDPGNTTTTPLAGGATFTGTAADTINWSGIILSVHSSHASATNGLAVQFSPNGTTDWFTSDNYTIAANSCKTFSFQPVGRYIRVAYTNGSTQQTSFFLCLQFRATATKASSHRMEDDISGQDDAELVKAILAAERPSPAGVYTNIQATNGGNLKVSIEEAEASVEIGINDSGNSITVDDGGSSLTVDGAVGIADGANLDAFSRLRVSSPDTVFDSTFQYDLQPLIYYTSTANGGAVAHDADLVSAKLTTAAQASSSAIIQSKAYHRYIPGKSQLIILTGLMDSATANIVKRAGYFDAENGIFLEQNGTTDLAIVRRTSVGAGTTDNRVPQASWNLDPLNGNGPSGLTLNLANVYILIIDLQWLGMGRVRVGFDIGGQIVYAHEFLNANVLTTVYMQTANLPIRWEMSGNGVEDMYATCAAVISEGGADRYLGYQFAYNRASLSAGSGTQTYAFSIRPKATFNSITNRTFIKPTGFTIVGGSNPVLVEVYYGTTVAGTPSWSDLDATYSALQVDTAGTPSGGVKVESFVVGSSAANRGADLKNFGARYPLTLDIAGTGYTNMTVYVTGLGGASTCFPGMIWEEIR